MEGSQQPRTVPNTQLARSGLILQARGCRTWMWAVPRHLPRGQGALSSTFGLLVDVTRTLENFTLI